MEAPYFLPKAEDTFLALSRPLVFFDLETTGANPVTDRIVELYAIRVNADGTQDELHHLIHPTIPIPQEAINVHGITNEMVAGKPTFGMLAAEIAAFFRGCDLAGYNIKRFDVPLLLQEFQRCGKYPINFNDVKMVDVMAIYHSKEKRDLAAAVRFYLQREHKDAHSAKADVQATLAILKKQLLLYDDLEPNTGYLHDYLSAGSTVDGSGRFKRSRDGEILFNFGKHAGQPACQHPDYLEWMIREGDFPADTKMVANRIYKHCLWEKAIKDWITKNNLTSSKEVASALYTTVKFGEGINPFATAKEGEKLTITYQSQPPSSFTFENGDAIKVLLSILDAFLREKTG